MEEGKEDISAQQHDWTSSDQSGYHNLSSLLVTCNINSFVTSAATDAALPWYHNKIHMRLQLLQHHCNTAISLGCHNSCIPFCYYNCDKCHPCQQQIRIMISDCCLLQDGKTQNQTDGDEQIGRNPRESRFDLSYMNFATWTITHSIDMSKYENNL